MIVHIFPKEKFTVPYINFINERFDNNEHLFFLYGSNEGYKEGDLKFNENIKDINKNKIEFLKSIYKCEKIILHSLFIGTKLMTFLFMQKWLLKKSTWVIWGADLYEYRNKNRNFKGEVREFLRRNVIKNIHGIGALVKKDYDLATKWYKTSAKYYDAIYMDTETIDYLEIIKDKKLHGNEDKCINILLGNSAYESNNHMEILDELKRFKEENIKVYCPLSYGIEDYGKKVIEYGQAVLNDKFVPVTEFLDINNYMDLLNKMNIGIFNNDRQQALGNIYSLIYLGKKVYLRNDTSMWSEIINNYKLCVFSIDELKKEDFSSFIFFENDKKRLNYQHIKPRYDNRSIKLKWQKIFTGQVSENLEV